MSAMDAQLDLLSLRYPVGPKVLAPPAPSAAQWARAADLAALVVRARNDVPDVPPHEQWLCAGAALVNFLNALHLMGFGAKALSGASVSDPAVHGAFCSPAEQLASWGIAGQPTRAAHSRVDSAASLAISDWQGHQV